VGAGHVAHGVRHGHDGEAEREGDPEEADAGEDRLAGDDVGHDEERREDRRAAAAEDEPERAEELCAEALGEEAAARSLKTVDATCPLVTKVHREAVRFADADYDILLIGHEGHEEVVGTSGEAPDHITIVDGPADVANVEVRDPEKVVWLSQTTLSVDETMETVRLLREKFPSLQDPPSDDICYATQNRQLAVKQMARECDLMIVVGSRNSSNSVRLVEVALEHGSRAGHLVDYAAEIDEGWLDGVSTVGVTSGASVPEILVREVLEFLSDRGFGDVRPVVAAEESLMFALPNEIRRDLKAAGMSDKMIHDAASLADTGSLH
jgi:4-hydroxy-3-methylbut-2-enyl diphosphate reductase